MIERLLYCLFFLFLGFTLGWYFHGHPDKLFDWTGQFGEYAARQVDRTPVCPDGYVCRKTSQDARGGALYLGEEPSAGGQNTNP